MKIYYIKRRNESPEDIWFEDLRFFSTEEKAQAECDKLEAKEKEYWVGCYNRNFDLWRLKDDAYQLLLDKGHNAKEVMPYHKRDWKTEVYQLKYAVDSVEVEE